MGKIVYLYKVDKFGGVMMEDRKLKKGELDAIDIANYFLSKESMSNKKLQKLCYYAQAWHYAFHDEGLFHQDVEAWVHGPVIKDLYKKFRIYKWNDIPCYDEEVNVSVEVAEFLEDVYNKYGDFSGDELEILTHQELPWQEARGGLDEWEPSDKIINPVTMSDYYWGKYEHFI